MAHANRMDGELGVGAQQFFLDLLLLLVEGVAHVLPHFALYVELLRLLVDDANHACFLVDVVDGAQGAVHPALVLVVLDEDHLCARLQLEFHRRGERGLRKVALDGSEEERGRTFEGREMLLVDVVHDVASGSEGDGEGVVWSEE